MRATWPEDALDVASLGDVFDEALRPAVRPFVLVIPAAVEDAGQDAVAAWLAEHHPGYPVIVGPEKRSLKDWVRKGQEWEQLSPEERAQKQRDWLAAFGPTDQAFQARTADEGVAMPATSEA
jgi:hypothetical protein